MNELCTKGAGELAGMIASGAVMSSEVIAAYLARIEEVNPDLNAVTATLAGERARLPRRSTVRSPRAMRSARWAVCPSR